VINENATESVIAVIDDDESVGRSLAGFLKAPDVQPVVFRSAEVCHADQQHPQFDSSTVDLQLDGMSGVAMRDRLRSAGVNTPMTRLAARDDKKPDRLALGGTVLPHCAIAIPGRRHSPHLAACYSDASTRRIVVAMTPTTGAEPDERLRVRTSKPEQRLLQRGCKSLGSGVFGPPHRILNVGWEPCCSY
jgi:CheY-like chemotaxis protein